MKICFFVTTNIRVYWTIITTNEVSVVAFIWLYFVQEIYQPPSNSPHFLIHWLWKSRLGSTGKIKMEEERKWCLRCDRIVANLLWMAQQHSWIRLIWPEYNCWHTLSVTFIVSTNHWREMNVGRAKLLIDGCHVFDNYCIVGTILMCWRQKQSLVFDVGCSDFRNDLGFMIRYTVFKYENQSTCCFVYTNNVMFWDLL